MLGLNTLIDTFLGRGMHGRTQRELNHGQTHETRWYEFRKLKDGVAELDATTNDYENVGCAYIDTPITDPTNINSQFEIDATKAFLATLDFVPPHTTYLGKALSNKIKVPDEFKNVLFIEDAAIERVVDHVQILIELEKLADFEADLKKLKEHVTRKHIVGLLSEETYTFTPGPEGQEGVLTFGRTLTEEEVAAAREHWHLPNGTKGFKGLIESGLKGVVDNG